MSERHFDLFTIGAGSGGVRASRVAASLGARSALAEMGPLGGTCVNAGCIPKKILVYAAQLAEAIEDAPGYGWSLPAPAFDWPALIAAKDRHITFLNGHYQRMLDRAGVSVVRGRARLVGPHEIEVDGVRFHAEHIVVATGSRPVRLGVPGEELTITSNEVFHLPQFPRRVVIVGGGYIAVELAGVFNALGAAVTLLYRGSLFLRGFDLDIRTTLAERMASRGIDIRWETELAAVTGKPGNLEATTTNGDRLAADQVVIAAGRAPNTADLGLDAAGIDHTDRGGVIVDRNYRSSQPHIFALGDCIDGPMLTPVAIAEAERVARSIFGSAPSPIDYDAVPTAVFSLPEIGTVGLSEDEARNRGLDITVYRSTFRSLCHAVTPRTDRTLVKLVCESARGRVLGAHMVGPHAGEIIQGIAIAVTLGLTKEELDRTIAIHPTNAEEFVTLR